jgi:hypothetical protein
MAAAKKLNLGILCDESTFTGSGKSIIFKAEKAIKVKGRKDMLPIWRPLRKHRRKVTSLMLNIKAR